MKKSKIIVAISIMCLVVCGIALANERSSECDYYTQNTECPAKIKCSHSQEDKPCRYCKGKGYVDCTSCYGTGWRTCSMCAGTGKIVYRNGEEEQCENCKGEGKFKCGYCKNGRRMCDACDGTGVTQYVGK